MNSLRLEPISSVAGVVNLPGSKSVSNRALLLAALARGTTRLTNLLDSDDIRHMLAALTQLGVKYKLSADKTECTVHGLGRSFAVSAPVNLFLGNAGTAMRPLCAALWPAGYLQTFQLIFCGKIHNFLKCHALADRC